MSGRRVVVIGAGLGGLSAALHLANAGLEVTILERGPRPGGKMNEWRADGFRFDTGPTLLTMPHVLDDLYAAVGERREDHLTLRGLEPLCRYRFPDGSMLDQPGSMPGFLEAVERFAPGEGPRMAAVIDYGRRAWEFSEPFLERSVPEAVAAVPWGNPSFGRRALGMLTLRSLHGLARRHLREPRLTQLVDRYATYLGSSPYHTPAMFALVLYAELQFGGWAIEGGMYRLASSLAGLAESRGARLHCSTPAERLEISDGRVHAVHAGGRRFAADAVVANADAAVVYRDLLPSAPTRAGRRALRRERATSGFVMLLGARGDFPSLAHHTVFFSDDYPREFRQLFRERRPLDNPTVYVCSSRAADDAPPGHTALFVMVNAPAGAAPAAWSDRRGTGDALIARLEAHGLTDLRRRVVLRREISPLEFEREYGAPGGTIYGPVSHGQLAVFGRQPNQDRAIPNLFFAGGSAHPGGGVPIVLLSGRIAARLAATLLGAAPVSATIR